MPIISGGSGSGSGSLVKIFDSTLAAPATTIDTGANGIPAGHGDITAYVLARTAGAVVVDFMLWRVNADSSAIYDQQDVSGTASAAGAGASNAQTGWGPFTHGASGGASYPGVNVLFIPSYDQTTFWKVGAISTGTPDTGTGGFAMAWAVGYRSTAAISRLAVSGGSAGAVNLATGSRLVIYGSQ